MVFGEGLISLSCPKTIDAIVEEMVQHDVLGGLGHMHRVRGFGLGIVAFDFPLAFHLCLPRRW